MTPIYSQHIETIRARWPDVAQKLDDASVDTLHFEVIEKKTVTLTVNGIQLGSAYDPIEEAFHYRSLTEGSDYHVWGLGMGNVPTLLSHDQHASSIKVYIYNVALAKLVLSLIPQAWLNDPRFTLIVVEQSDSDINAHVASLTWPGCIIINADKAISRFSHQWLYFRMENRLFVAHANANYSHNDDKFLLIEEENKPLLKRLQSIDVYMLYPVEDAICIGAGPSLLSHIEELKHVYNRPNRPKFIAAATACRCLLEHGIKPDVVFAVDIDIPDSYIPYDIAKNTILVFASRMPKRIFQNWQGEKYYCHLAEHTYDRFAETLPVGFRPFAFGSVIHPLIHCTLMQGAKRVSFIGCDFGFPGDIIHAGMENDPNDPHTTMTERVENGHGELIKTSPAYRMFGTGVENLISAFPQTTFFNWSRMGAKIYGASYLNVSETYD
ncbi:6-hydroxymethylpterin diphosphokinase MptE-like protein [Enterovibrio coralii]|uniref:6-hydroxymethylpterin diphosphokinase MptE-like domain-containing protein n=1 Tax=Enterovibrio coralii TaxID=294935 RepID=A0A135I6K9_9GAMM|nr:6-hydroxymethylpterin diphosphokinase MptE-like protein [Enterovibrio coralii]KXF81082.1 hypothetical protein ATN88_19145 [Enterovibrio coralii]